MAHFVAVLVFKFKSVRGAARGVKPRLQPRMVLKRTLLAQQQLDRKPIRLASDFRLYQVRRGGLTGPVRQVLLLLRLNRHDICL